MDSGRSALLMGAALGVLGLIALRALQSGAASFSVQDAAAGAVSATVGALGDVASGAVLGIGDAVGVPRTDAMLCDISKARGDVLGASKYCTAGDFLAWTLAGQPTGATAPASSQSVQQPHTTDLPEGSYQAPAMFWSLHPNDVFYD
ncbi:hypothetical protein [Azoarcus sp. CIB]|uniref:hypothetical protein n=1 Tax=Aromatoleum sp. (strain CIB) TaxID=198107 RepID=UPI00067CA436|nr:hypothetical protein [Azoarcus sp. CIB]